MVEKVRGKVAGLPEWKMDATSDEPHGKKHGETASRAVEE
jgi:hypothetical protein